MAVSGPSFDLFEWLSSAVVLTLADKHIVFIEILEKMYKQTYDYAESEVVV